MRLLMAIMLSCSLLWPTTSSASSATQPFIIINKATNQLAFIRGGRIEAVYPVATGVTTALTPEGLFTVKVKAKNPYYRKKSIPGGAPSNPLGTRWIGFDAQGTDGRIYGIHGTNNSQSIGRYVTQGCVRMHNRDVETLYEKIPEGTKVFIVRSNESFAVLARQQGAMR
ncbi:L,D-transpeptidase catalytic domain protein [Anoxybacillus sp. B7M1]|uniref:L,D-transpeptidase n=1 Tax=unclassified Anoxybacillus TaxID=2639704 RepID=UPI0005CCEA43|nr:MULTISPECIES: L,D-transpeptidase [unclassified Anoxybacillus]ANB56594.1 L,D-transpeptidase catalytic domain protein [Anoxybacillus sp. B2M1]ANB64071.1 L,D-transpeptidase catalytic domain protein [Anoxybacillus sp. B7M1]